ncbi:MbtH family NRPS accessory protein [Nonomuraea gerenzanensis]|uniref:MbtH protein n=2 Tax=Nonomuraea gerenzanensis TaxID=93944 RepID=A0A1M4EFX9_9ACTN|nr:MbtH family NRPS accessory protein [Nonomuraea gerenzanensis]SBO97720.1 MbtH protein [Nonomuraea gerenzanensis]
MSSLADDPAEHFLVVVNEEGRHSLWPQLTTPPSGWTPVHGPDDRAGCLAYIEEHWTDLRPLGLLSRLAEPGGPRGNARPS